MSGTNALYYAAAATTAIAGILHLMLGPGSLGFNISNAILFIVGGIAQVFWIIPMARRWGTPWYSIGIGGTIVLILLWVVTRFPGNPITGRGGPAGNPMAIATELFQIMFLGLAAAIIIYERKNRKPQEKKDKPAKNNKQVIILGAIVVALILTGLFVLPMAMPRPGGPTPGGNQPGPGGPPGQQIGAPTQTSASTDKTCTITPSLIEVEGTPQQTEGPYFVDKMPNRSDIRLDTSNGTISAGIPLNLAIHVFDIDDSDGDGKFTCIPLPHAQVDIWHTDSQGIYSGVQDAGTVGRNFLRGYQLTDENGTANFTTIYPGWYEGRAIHIHIKVRTFEGTEKTFEWTSQFYMDDAVNKDVHTQAPYSNQGSVNMTNAQDGIYAGASTDGLVQRNAGSHLVLNLTQEKGGYAGTFNVAVEADKD